MHRHLLPIIRSVPPPAIGDPLLLSVIVPARNEAECLGDCLGSLTAQSEPGFLLGVDWEIFCVDDASMDRTRVIARSFVGVTLLDAPLLAPGWTGKSAAIWHGVSQTRGAVLLFTDADTIHEPGSLQRALHEREKNHAAMLSYSPRQIVQGFWQRALMPLVFSELTIAVSAGAGERSRVAHRGCGERPVPDDRARGLLQNWRPPGRRRVRAGGCRPSAALQARRANHPLPLRAGRSGRAHVPQPERHGGGLDEESGAALSASRCCWR